MSSADADAFAAQAFVLFADHMGVAAVRSFIDYGRTEIAAGGRGIFLDEEDLNAAVTAAGVSFTISPFGTLRVDHRVADDILLDLAARAVDPADGGDPAT